MYGWFRLIKKENQMTLKRNYSVVKISVVKIFSVAGLLCLPINSVLAQDDFEAYRNQQIQGAQQVKSEFREYKEKQDREFAGFLKGQWSEFKTVPGEVRLKEPEPKQAPVVPASPKAPVSAAPIVLAPVTPPPPPLQEKPVSIGANEMELIFFGNVVKFAYDPKWTSYKLTGGAKPETMSDFWTQMSGSNYEQTIQTINAARRELNLDDWGYVTLWRDVVRALQPGHKSEQNLLLWYFLVKSGYDVRLGYYDADVFLFVAIRQPVYSTKYTKVNDQVYYAALAEDHGNGIRAFYSYKSDYPTKLKALDIKAASTGFTKSVTGQRTLAFDYKGQTIKFNVNYDRRLIEYFESFPQIDFELYFDTDSSSMLRQGLLPQLKKYTATMGEEEAVDFLLAFVQHAFAYKTDIDQFGYQKCFFIEESIYFPYNDCKDRSVIFAWLVKELLGIKVVGLLYPGHMTTGVELKQVKEGFTTVRYQGKRFVIADPTYIGASVGMPMPFYAKLSPTRVVEIQ
jgi:hypothetical protein